MKKVFAIIMAMVMVLSMGTVAFADGSSDIADGKITITNATIDTEYKLFKIFDASYSTDADKKTVSVAYTIDTTDQFYDDLFGTDGKTENTYFAYNAETGAVTKKENVNDSDLISYLTDLVDGEEPTNFATADDAELVFDNLEHGYYVITSGLGTAVTINSNTPEVKVIDKNQKPLSKFNKQVKNEGETVYSDGNTMNIGDKMNYLISFEATNYYGAAKVKYYQVHDEIGVAIWADFRKIQVKVGDEVLQRGYYLNATGGDAPVDENGNPWTTLGDWTGYDTSNPDLAQWYLVHLGRNQFRITIPWLEEHKLVNEGNYTYSLLTDESNASKYASPVMVYVSYDATLEYDAYVGGGDMARMENKAYASAICQSETHSTTVDEVLTETYGIGLLKDDGTTLENLAGAEFRLYSDAGCTEAVNVIPTNFDGVYIVDSYGRSGESVSGVNELPRDKYPTDAAPDNLVVSQLNGKLVVLGLERGTYYLKEVKAPDGYNSLTAPVAVELNSEKATAFNIFANDAGDVANTQFATGDYREYEFEVTSTTVHNSKGVELPSTGGEGTMLLITFGSLIAVAFAVLLITRKKMSVYED